MACNITLLMFFFKKFESIFLSLYIFINCVQVDLNVDKGLGPCQVLNKYLINEQEGKTCDAFFK